MIPIRAGCDRKAATMLRSQAGRTLTVVLPLSGVLETVELSRALPAVPLALATEYVFWSSADFIWDENSDRLLPLDSRFAMASEPHQSTGLSDCEGAFE